MLLAAGIATLLLRERFKRTWLAAFFMWLFIVMAGFMRANAVFGMPPLIDLAISAVSPRWRAQGFIKRMVVAGLLSLLFIPGHYLADNYVFRVKDIKPVSQLQVFDIGGITYFSGPDGFKGFFGPGFVARTETSTTESRGCYTPRHWDTYGWDPISMAVPEVYENLKPQFGAPLTKLWVEAIAVEAACLSHPSLCPR